jgi:uncharacterized RDD family membrane protein YckC
MIMQSRTRGFSSSIIAALLCLLVGMQAHAKDLLVDASSRSMWVAATVAGESGGPAESLIFARAMGTDQWQQLYQIASPTISLTHQDGEPAILLSNGQWMFVYQDGRSLGADVPGGGQLMQLTSTGKTICGAAWIDGGLSGMTATTHPSSTPADQKRLVLLSYKLGQWQGLAEIPGVPANAAISMAGMEGNLLLAFRSKENQLQVYQWSTAAGLQILLPISATFKIADFKTLYDGDKALVWLAPATGAGCICRWDRPWSPLIPLADASNLAKAQTRDICVDADQQLRLVYSTGDQLFEQNYDQHGQAAGKPTEILTQQQDDTDTSSTHWLGIAFIALAVFVLLSAFRRPQVNAQLNEQGPKILLASLARRLGAGLVDLIPYFVIVITLSPRVLTSYSEVFQAANDPAFRNPVLIAMGVYLFHTTVSELFFARTIGKLIFGLKVINLQGGRPSVLAVLARNFFRPIDSMVFFLTILILPLRQRLGDLAGGTVVVRAKELPPEPIAPEGENST